MKSVPEHLPAMVALRRLVSDAVPGRVRDGIRFLTNSEFRGHLLLQRRRARQRRLVEKITPRLWEQTKGVIASGPFKGMQYLGEAVGSAWAPKLLGTYEMELAPVVEAIVTGPARRILDIGAAEGYYAVGLAWRMPAAHVVAFETETTGRDLLDQLATVNRVAARVAVQGHCSPDLLAGTLADGAGTVVVCDAEGAEFELLDLDRIPGLMRADILVEVHAWPWYRPDLLDVIRTRFARTHAMQLISARARQMSDLPPAVKLPRTCAVACLDEIRLPGMAWLWMTASRSAS